MILFRDRDCRRSKPFRFALCTAAAGGGLHLGISAAATSSAPTRVTTRAQHAASGRCASCIATLAITPLRRLSGRAEAHPLPPHARPVRLLLRRVHLTIYLVLDLGGYWSQLSGRHRQAALHHRRLAALLLLVPLAITSTAA